MNEDPRLGEAIAACLEGEEPEKVLARYPDLRDELRAFLAHYGRFDELARPIRALVSSEASRPMGALGDYELLDVIAEGGMGVIYRARKAGLDRVVALKMIRGPRPSDREIRRFQVEADAVMRLDHPQIVRLFDYGECQGSPYFTMQLLEAGTLEDHQGRFGEPRVAARLVETLARAVEHAHTRGILHRDLKPQNILFDREFHPYIADWGLAKQTKEDQRITGSGYAYGTPAYMAPEQMEGTITTQADIYSLGVILYELLTGQVPLLGETARETLDLRANRRPDPPPVGPDLQAVVLKCLEPKPEDRFKSAKDLADDLDRWLAGKPVKVRGAVSLLRMVRHVSKKILSDGRRRELHQELLYVSSAVADRVLSRLKDWSGAVLEAANDPDLPVRMRSKHPETFLDRIRGTFDDPARGAIGPGEASPFETWLLFDDRGTMIATSPRESIVGQDFSRREWYWGARSHDGKRGIHSVHVSRVFLSLVRQNLCKFTLTAPVYACKGTDVPVLGVIGASFTTDADLGIPQLHDDRHKVGVVGRWDPDSYGGYSESDYLVLVHPAYRRGDETVKVNTPCLQSLIPQPERGELRSAGPGQGGRLDEEFQDPLAARDKQYEGPWWAGIAPVGNTNLAAIVQRRPPEWL